MMIMCTAKEHAVRVALRIARDGIIGCLCIDTRGHAISTGSGREWFQNGSGDHHIGCMIKCMRLAAFLFKHIS